MFIPPNNVLHSPISSSSGPSRLLGRLLVADVVGVGGTGKLRFISQCLPVWDSEHLKKNNRSCLAWQIRCTPYLPLSINSPQDFLEIWPEASSVLSTHGAVCCYLLVVLQYYRVTTNWASFSRQEHDLKKWDSQKKIRQLSDIRNIILDVS